jgi:hypothetical protein
LIDLLAKYSLPLRYSSGVSLVGIGKREVETLLEAVFSEWIDLIFVPEPGNFRYTPITMNSRRSSLRRSRSWKNS